MTNTINHALLDEGHGCYITHQGKPAIRIDDDHIIILIFEENKRYLPIFAYGYRGAGGEWWYQWLMLGLRVRHVRRRLTPQAKRFCRHLRRQGLISYRRCFSEVAG